MIDQNIFIENLHKNGVKFFVGVPDSYLNGFCEHILNNIDDSRHIVAPNEGNAVAMAAGHFISTGELSLVYMQNSGIGNAMNPLMSLADRNVYGIPMIILIGWRGEPGTKDSISHPQHEKQGKITCELLDLMNIPYVVADNSDELFKQQLNMIVNKSKTYGCPVAIVARHGVFTEKKKKNKTDNSYCMSRQKAIELILDTMPSNTIYIATTGRTTRELFFLREKRSELHNRDFLNIGSMGHASSVAIGIARAKKNTNVVCLDGDAAVFMHMGALSIVSKITLPNFLHVVLNNGAHDSVGGQPTAGYDVDFTQIAKNCGYNVIGNYIYDKEGLMSAINQSQKESGPFFVDVRVHKGLDEYLPPLNIRCQDLNRAFMKEIQEVE